VWRGSPLPTFDRGVEGLTRGNTASSFFSSCSCVREAIVLSYLRFNGFREKWSLEGTAEELSNDT
jgi:hypothetical protein